MPLDPPLRQHAEHNERSLATFDLDTTPYLDWAVVVAFNAAFRYVDAYFQATRRARPVDHPERLRWISEDAGTRPIWPDYRRLYSESRNARYEIAKFDRAQVRALAQNRLGRLRTHMLRQ